MKTLKPSPVVLHIMQLDHRTGRIELLRLERGEKVEIFI